MRTSVIIPTFNRESELCNTIQQVLDQIRIPDEIIVVDQTKKHQEDTESFLKEMESKGKIILIKESVPNVARARNIGFRYSTGEIIIFIDDDVLLKKNFIEMHCDEYKDIHTDAVSGVVYDTRGRELYGTYNSILKKAFTNERFINLPGGNTSIRRNVLESLCGFDEKFILSSVHEDKDLSLRLCKAGYKVAISRKASLVHLLSLGGGRSVAGNRLVPRKERLIPQMYFYLKNTTFLPNIYYFLKLLQNHVVNYYKLKHPVLLFRSLLVFNISFFKALSIWLQGDREIKFSKKS